MKKICVIGLLSFVALIFCYNTAYPQTDSRRHSPDYYLHQTSSIVGTWEGLKPHGGLNGSVWVFKANGTMKKGKDGKYRSYKLVKGATHKQCSGVYSNAKIFNPDELVLIIKGATGKNLCYDVAYLGYNKVVNETLMSLWFLPAGNHLAFKKR